MRVAFLHPDLGIGGAERLIVDAAIGLQSYGHYVTMYTNHYDRGHCFEETKYLDIKLINYFPRTIFGKMWALCACIRMCIAAILVCLNGSYNVIIVDQVSACIPILKLFSKARIIFYCHYPDQLLTTRDTTPKYLYRLLLDKLEEFSTEKADKICVNSNFTASVVRNTFKSLKDRQLEVLYPSLNTKFFDEIEKEKIADIPPSAKYVFTSLNRYEVKKNVKLAIESFVELKLLLSADVFKKCHLVIAGGYDKLNYENVAYYKQLNEYATDLEIDPKQITFLKSPSDKVKVNLLRASTAILYTPDNEHFGIVPVEAMYVGVPVIAVNSGGPRESIDHGKTGFLLSQNSVDFALGMRRLIEDEALRAEMTINGPARVQKLFSFDSFASRLNVIVNRH